MFTLNADGYFLILFEYGVSLVVCDVAKDRQRWWWWTPRRYVKAATTVLHHTLETTLLIIWNIILMFPFKFKAIYQFSSVFTTTLPFPPCRVWRETRPPTNLCLCDNEGFLFISHFTYMSTNNMCVENLIRLGTNIYGEIEIIWSFIWIIKSRILVSCWWIRQNSYKTLCA